MEEYSTEPVGTVDPEVRAYVTSLVSALGGSGGYDDGRYVLGDEALACLRDLKRWLKLYDEKTNRLDVARVLAERNLVKGDLLEILAAWPEEDIEDRLKSRVALACLELLVPLTWPIEKNELNPTANHFRNTPYLQLAQISYKREIFEHPSSSILRTTARVALSSLSIPAGERTQRDEGIIKLLLYFYRNIVMISAPATLPVEWNENEVSRSATIHALHDQDVFPLLLTIASSMGEDFNTQDVVVLEILFHLLKGVDVHELFLDEAQLEARHGNDLQNLISKEANMLRGYTKNAPTRHNRFGTMIWVQRDEERVSAVSGQEVLSNEQHALEKMDHSKKWDRPKRRLKEDTTSKSFDLQVPLTNSATQDLRSFVEEFLDSGFNPLFSHLRRAIERETERVADVHSHQFFFLTAWFLEAERARRESKKATSSNNPFHATMQVDSFGIVASVLNQETFILLGRFMQEKFDVKEWSELNAGMRAFTQILLTVQMMAESSLEDDREIADNIQNRIFYEEATHDRVLAILRGYKDQSFGYLDASTELAHVFLRMLERYSKENINLQVRSRRRARKRKEAKEPNENEDGGDTDDSEAEELADAQRVSKERKFDSNRFSARFVNQGCVNTFVSLLSFYKTLTEDQLKRILRFFHRVAFKQEMSVLLFRLDIISLFSRITDGPDGLDKSNALYKEWAEFVKQLFRKLVKKMKDEDAMIVELLFSKINATTYYLEYGHEKQTLSSNPRAPFELEFVKELSLREQLGVLIAAMLEDGEEQGFAVTWVENALRSAADERKSWEAEREARTTTEAGTGANQPQEASQEPPPIVAKADNDARRTQMYKYNKLRLLMTLVGFQRQGEEEDVNGAWVVPSVIPSTQLVQHADWIWDIRQDPPYRFGEESVPAAELLRRKIKGSDEETILNTFGEDSDDADALNDDLLYLASGPSVRKSTALEQLKKKRRRRQRPDIDNVHSTDEDTQVTKPKPKPLLAKSKEFIYDSDEDAGSEADREFFAQEETRRSEQVSKIIETLRTHVDDDTSTKKRKNIDTLESISKKLRSTDDEDEDDVDLTLSADETGAEAQSHSNHLRTPKTLSNEKDIGFSNEEEDSDTPPSSEIGEKEDSIPGKASTTPNVDEPRVSKEGIHSIVFGNDEETDNEDIEIRRAARRRGNIAVLDDSDEE